MTGNNFTLKRSNALIPGSNPYKRFVNNMKRKNNMGNKNNFTLKRSNALIPGSNAYRRFVNNTKRNANLANWEKTNQGQLWAKARNGLLSNPLNALRKNARSRMNNKTKRAVNNWEKSARLNKSTNKSVLNNNIMNLGANFPKD